MKTRSTLSALALSMMAALVAATVIMPPVHRAGAEAIAARCQGYHRLTILLGSANRAEQFSMHGCTDAMAKS